MKVYIGPYQNWWGVYQTVDLLQKVGVSEDTCEKIGDWICDNTPVEDFFHWIDRLKGQRKVKVRIDKYDTWNMDNTLAHIILPMLKQLKETKHGSPLVDDEDLPSHMRHTFSKGPDDYETDDRWVHYKWEWVLNEMIWAFEQELDDSWEDKFVHGESDIEWIIVSGKEEDDSAMYEMKQKNPDYWVDREGIKQYNDRINNGFRLFGKYYRGLWD
jgi:hypothetical protein